MPNVIPSPIPFATATAPGIVSTAAQTLGAGSKTFLDPVLVSAQPTNQPAIVLTSGAGWSGQIVWGATWGGGGVSVGPMNGTILELAATNRAVLVAGNGDAFIGSTTPHVSISSAGRASGLPQIQIAGTGVNSSDIAIRAGFSTADGSVHASAKLLSVRTGIGGTENEKFWITKSGPAMTSTQAFEMNGDGGGVKLQYRTSDGMAGIHNGAAAYLGMFPGTGASGCSGTFTSDAGFFRAGNSIGVNLFGQNGTGASDVTAKVGTNVADGSVNSAAKLFSVRTGIGGTEVEKFWIDKLGDVRTGGSVGSSGWFRGQSASLGRLVVDDSSGSVLRYNNMQVGITGAGVQIFNHSLANLWFCAASGRVDQYGTDSSGTPGAATIDKPTGISAIISGASSVVITNSLATATSRVMVTWLGDHGAARWWVTRAAGSFTVNLSAAASANTAFAWEVSSLL